MATAPTISPLRLRAVPATHQRVPHERQLGLLAAPLAVEPGIGVGGRGVGLVAARLAMEVLLAVATRVGRWGGAVLRPEALGAGPGFQQRAVHREMLGREQRLDLGLCQHRGQELQSHVALQQAVAVLGEGRGVPYRVIHAEADEPAEQQVELDPLDQLPL